MRGSEIEGWMRGSDGNGQMALKSIETQIETQIETESQLLRYLELDGLAGQRVESQLERADGARLAHVPNNNGGRVWCEVGKGGECVGWVGGEGDAVG